MKAGQMAKAISNVTGADLATVRASMRYQRQAGFLTQGARGINAPDMTSVDLAMTLLVVLADSTPGTRAGMIAEKIGGLQVHGDENTDEFSLEFMRGLEPPFTFAEALAALIEVYAFDQDKPQYQYNTRRRRDGGTVHPRCHVEIYRESKEAMASIKIGPPYGDEADLTGIYFFQRPQHQQYNPATAGPCIASARWINEASIRPLADAFAGRAET